MVQICIAAGCVGCRRCRRYTWCDGEKGKQENAVFRQLNALAQQHVAITGASSGIGAELARAYAVPGRRLSLAARRLDRLDEVAERCRRLGAEVATASVDVRDNDAVSAWFEAADDLLSVDLVIANAGVFDGHGPDGAWETAAEARAVIEVNVTGAIYTAQAAMARMRDRGAGHIAIVSSLAAILPAADAPTYSASKAALVAYGDAIRMQLADDGVRVSVILPGHVQTAQTAVHVGPLAMMISATDAAATIKRGLDRGRAQIAFPCAAHWLVRIASVLPWRIRMRATKSDRFYVQKDGG